MVGETGKLRKFDSPSPHVCKLIMQKYFFNKTIKSVFIFNRPCVAAAVLQKKTLSLIQPVMICGNIFSVRTA